MAGGVGPASCLPSFCHQMEWLLLATLRSNVASQSEAGNRLRSHSNVLEGMPLFSISGSLPLAFVEETVLHLVGGGDEIRGLGACHY